MSYHNECAWLSKKLLIIGVSVFFILPLCCTKEARANMMTPRGNRTHPYLYFNKEDIPALRQAAGTTHKYYFEYLKRWADKFIGFDPLSKSGLPSNIDIMQVYCENSMSYIFNMSLIYQLTGDTTYLKAARKWLLTFATYPSEINGNFCVGAYAVAVASGYDMLYNELNATDRNRLSALLAAIIERGKKGTVSDWWAGISLSHDHWLPVTGLGVGAAALYYENDKAPEWLDYFLNILKTDMNIVGDDGAWVEGAADWVYAMSLPYVFFDVYKRLSAVDMFQSTMVKNSIAYRMYNWLPDNSYIYHHDSFANGRYNVLGAVSSNLLHKLAREHQDGHMQWLASQDEKLDMKDLDENIPIRNDWCLSKKSLVPYLHCVGWNFLWYDANVKPLAPDNLPLYHYFPNKGLIIMRTGWQKSDVVFSFACAPVGGHNAFKAVLEGNKKILENYGHIHAMANSFDLYAYGNYLAIPPSYGLTGSNFQNTLTIEGAIQQRSPIYEADLLKADLREDYAYVVGDATQCYPASIGLERWYRHVAFLPPDIFVIGDELSAAGTSTMNRITRWHIDYNPLFASTIDSVNQIIRITDKSALQANILYPAKPTYENIKVSPAVKQVNVMIKDIFSSDKERQILVVLSALENTATGAPASRLIRGENTIGAVVDSRNASRAAIFCINNKDGKDSFNRNFDFTSRSHTTCYLFSFLPDTGYDVSVSSKPGKDGMILYHMRVQKGKKYKTNSEGTMIVKTDDLR